MVLLIKTYTMISLLNLSSKRASYSVSFFKVVAVCVLLLPNFLSPAFGQKGNNDDKKPKEKQWKKITICHKGETIEISESALQAHLNHGDAVGPCDDVVFDGNVVPFLEAQGKIEEPIGSELTALEESFEDNGGAASDEIFVVNENVNVLLEIVAQRGKVGDLLDTLSNRYNITEEFFPGDPNDLIVTVLFPIDKLSELNGFTEVVRFARPVYKAITNGGVVTSQGDIATLIFWKTFLKSSMWSNMLKKYV